MKLNVVIIAGLLSGALCFAEDKKTPCSEYLESAHTIVSELEQIGQDKINQFNKKIQITDLKKIIQYPLTCIARNKLDRQAWSYPDRKLTALLGPAWNDLTDWERRRLVAHELAVIARYESAHGEGQYDVSKDIELIFENELKIYKYKDTAQKVVEDSDGGFVFFNPYIRIDKQKFIIENYFFDYYLDKKLEKNSKKYEEKIKKVFVGVCRRLGLNHFPESDESNEMDYNVCKKHNYATVDEYGLIRLVGGGLVFLNLCDSKKENPSVISYISKVKCF